MLKRYGGGADNVLSMPFFDGCELIKYALDAELEDRLYMRWVMAFQKEMSFGEFKEKVGGGNKTEDDRTADEILAVVRGIIG